MIHASATAGPTASTTASTSLGPPRAAGFLLGFALGGFFDGILLHQILQWHHLLSGLEDARFADLRVQVLADGVFHALMYAIGAIGLWLLWRGRRGLDAPGAGRALAAAGLIGFGVWHAVDAVVSHWLLGIHRIRMDAAAPLLWDIGWLVLFGLVPLAAGLMLRRSRGGPPDGRPDTTGGRRGPVAAALMALAVLAAGPVAALPPPGETPLMVLFPPGAASADIFAAIAAVDGRTVWNDPSGQVWAIEPAPGARTWTLLRHGAVPLGGGALPAGCLGWSKA